MCRSNYNDRPTALTFWSSWQQHNVCELLQLPVGYITGPLVVCVNLLTGQSQTDQILISFFGGYDQGCLSPRTHLLC